MRAPMLDGRSCALAFFLVVVPTAAAKSDDEAVRRQTQRQTQPTIGIVTMHTPDIMSYANYTEALNRAYADKWGYGFHVFGHVVDRTRVPHWSKIHAILLFLPEYEYLLWIDADAALVDTSRRIEDVFGVHAAVDKDFWAQDIWPDYPSLLRNELLDLGVALFRNSRWTRQFLLEMYHHPDCQEHLNWTEQYCFTVAYRQDFLRMRNHTAILQTPKVNHHILPPPDNPAAMFVLHLAGRTSKARAAHFAQVYEGRTQQFHAAPKAAPFWRFRSLFERHKFGGVASLQACLFGIGERHLSFLDAFLYTFPYMTAFTVILHGAPSLWSQMKSSEYVGERNPDRLLYMDVKEYSTGVTRDGDAFVKGFYCDLFVLGAETKRHLPAVDVLGKMARSGLDHYIGERGRGFGFSGIRDAYFVWLYDGCGGEKAASGTAPSTAEEGVVLDGDDEDGSAMVAACELLGETRRFVEDMLAKSEAVDAPAGRKPANPSAGSNTVLEDQVLEPLMWGVQAPGRPGVEFLGDVALARAPRSLFSEFAAAER